MESYGEWLYNKNATKAYLYGSKMVNIFKNHPFLEQIEIEKRIKNLKVTWNENWKTCCSIGMKPIAYVRSWIEDVGLHFLERQRAYTFQNKKTGRMQIFAK